MKKSLFLLLFVTINLSLFAGPADPHVRKKISLKNGELKEVALKGDEYFSYWQTLDNKECFIHEQGDFRLVPLKEIDQISKKSRNKVMGISSEHKITDNYAPKNQSYEKGAFAGVTTLEPQYKGNIRIPVIMVEFPDRTFRDSHTPSLFHDIYNMPGFNYLERFKGSVRDYFVDQSNNQFEPNFDILGPVTVSKNRSYYGQDDESKTDIHAAELATEVISLLENDLDLTVYDANNDNIVDVVVILFAGNAQEFTGNDDDIWAKLMSVGCSKNGMVFKKCAFVSELRPYASGENINSIGQACHELSHFLGLPDTYSNFPDDYGLDYWDIMGTGVHNDNGFTPAGYTAFGKMYVGWQSPILLEQNMKISDMKPLNEGGQSYIIPNDAHLNEFFLLENRQQRGWDSCLPGHGLLISHIDYDEYAFSHNIVNDTSKPENDYERYSLVVADNDKTKNAQSREGDAYPFMNNNEFTNNSLPASQLYYNNIDQSRNLSKPITNITEDWSGAISFNFNNDLLDCGLTYLSLVDSNIKFLSQSSIIFNTTIFNSSFEVYNGEIECRIYDKKMQNQHIGSLKGTTLISSKEYKNLEFTFDGLEENGEYVLRLFYYPDINVKDWCQLGSDKECYMSDIETINISGEGDYQLRIESSHSVNLIINITNDSFLPYDNVIAAYTYNDKNETQSPRSIFNVHIDPYSSKEVVFHLDSLEKDVLYNTSLYYKKDTMWIPMRVNRIPINLGAIKEHVNKIKIDGIYYDLMENEAIVLPPDEGYYTGDFIVPQTVAHESKTYTVKEMQDYIWSYCQDLTSLVVYPPLYEFKSGNWKREKSPNLKTIILPNVVRFGNWFFGNNCSSLETLQFGSKLESIGYAAFYECESLKELIIPDNVKSIGDYAFNGCNALETLKLGSELDSIGKYAFYGCQTLGNLVIPDNVKSIGDWGFAYCSILESLKLGSELESIGYAAFYKCESLKDLAIPDNVKSIGEWAFGSCNVLETLKLGSELDSIEKYAFYNCKSLESLQFGDELEVIEDSAFYNCQTLKELIISDKVRSIGDRAFYNCQNLDTLVIPNSVTSIGNQAFYSSNRNCKKIIISRIEDPFDLDVNPFSDIAFTNDILYVPYGTTEKYRTREVWKNFVNIREGEPTGTNKIEIDGIYYDLMENEAIVLPPDEGYYTGDFIVPQTVTYENKTYTVKEMQDSIWSYCQDLTSLIVYPSIYEFTNMYWNREKSPNLKTIILPNVVRFGNWVFGNNCSSLETLQFGPKLESIGYAAFYKCESLKDLAIPDNVKSIGDYAFGSCNALGTLKLGSELESIGKYAFSGCQTLGNLVIPNNVKSIGNHAFWNCNALETLTLGSELGAIEERAFYGCQTLVNLVIPENVRSIGKYAFYNCKSLESLRFGDELEVIEDSAFYNCQTLKELIISDKVRSIGDRAFYNCQNLDTLVIPNSVKSIGNQAFYSSNRNCKRTIISRIEDPFDLDVNPFSDIAFTNDILYVPYGTTEKYRAREVWKNFVNIIEGEPTGIKTPNADKSDATEKKRYMLSGQRTTKSQHGINIIKMSDGTVKKVMVK